MTIYVVNSDNGLQEAYTCQEDAITAAVKYIKEDPCYEEISHYDYKIEDDISREIGCDYHCYEFWVESIELVMDRLSTVGPSQQKYLDECMSFQKISR